MLMTLMHTLGILIPLAGAVALLLKREQSETTVRMMLTSIGCMVMNCGSMLVASAQTEAGAGMATKFEYLGNAMFFSFFIAFLLSYLDLRVPRRICVIWAVFESLVVAIYWHDRWQERFIGHFNYVRDNQFHIFRAEVQQSALLVLRYSGLLLILLLLLGIVVYRMLRTKERTERFNLARLAGAEFIMTASLLNQLFLHPRLDLVPFFASLSILPIVISMLTDGFFGVRVSGREWVFDQMENAYLIADSVYGYLDANYRAKELFPELKTQTFGTPLPDRIRMMLTANAQEYQLGDRHYSIKLSAFEQRGHTVGYGLLLVDVTGQRESVRLMENFNTRLQQQVEEQTQHIRLVQNSIIKGMASVIESRDNSTGGHIQRTSQVVTAFRDVLEKHRDELGVTRRFLHNVAKAAPLHDLGKIAVDDVILRKPGRFEDDEYEIMKSHAAKGAEVLKKVLHEVDDEEFVRIAINVAKHHHERWDGKGYPDGLAGEQIPLEARIMALADVLDALVSKRCYKEAFTFDKAFSIIGESLGTQFDPVLGRLFLECRPQIEQVYAESEPAVTVRGDGSA